MQTSGHDNHGAVRPIKRRFRLLVLPLLAALGVAGFIAAGSIGATGKVGTGATLSLGKTKLGHVLVTSKGHTIYLFKKDKRGKSACMGSCATFWPPLLRHGKVSLGPGVRRSMLGTTRRSNGTHQLTYRNHPLYTFALDKHAGQTKGQGLLEFGAKWYAVSKVGTAIVEKATPPPTTTTTNSCPYPPC
jgi:predicted lipoprotein with Yx(FWY)xxD motif